MCEETSTTFLLSCLTFISLNYINEKVVAFALFHTLLYGQKNLATVAKLSYSEAMRSARKERGKKGRFQKIPRLHFFSMEQKLPRLIQVDWPNKNNNNNKNKKVWHRPHKENCLFSLHPLLYCIVKDIHAWHAYMHPILNFNVIKNTYLPLYAFHTGC